MKNRLTKILAYVFAPVLIIALVFGGAVFARKKPNTQEEQKQEITKPYDWSEALASGFSVSSSGAYDVATSGSVLIDLSEENVSVIASETQCSRGNLSHTENNTTAHASAYSDQGDNTLPANMLLASLNEQGSIDVVVHANGADHYITASTDAEYVLGDLLTGGRQVVASGTKLYVASNTEISATSTSITDKGAARAMALSQDILDTKVAYVSKGTITFSNATYGYAKPATGDNTTVTLGHAFYIVGNSTSATFENVTIQNFNSNSANNKSGAAIMSTGVVLNLINCNFYDCKSSNGAVGTYSTTTISGCVFDHNSGSMGGALRSVNSQVTINSYVDTSGVEHKTVFSNNNASYGGAACLDTNISITNTIFENNRAASNGGALWGNHITLGSGTIVRSNTAGNGGGLYGSSFSIVGDVEISGNTATNYGGAIWANSISISSLTDENQVVVSPTISGNTATNYGGALYGTTGSCVISAGTFVGNTATDGGAVYHESGTLTISGGVFGDATKTTIAEDSQTNGVKNFSNKATQHGGAIYIAQSSSAVNITNATFAYNLANQNGGAIYVHAASATTLNLGAGVVIQYNAGSTANGANGGGGMWTNSGATVNITGGTYQYNKSHKNGGGFWKSNGSTISISGGTFSHNTTLGYGGVIYGHGTYTISSGTFEYNTANSGAGAIVISQTDALMNTPIRISGATFDSNSAGGAGALSLIKCKNVIIGNANFVDNANTSTSSSSRDGGTLRIENDCTVTIDGANISGSEANSASAHGGAIALPGSNTTVTIQGNTSIIGCVANGSGGAIWTNVGTVNIAGGTISGCSASRGGAIATNTANAVVTISGGTISNNTAEGYGGGVYLQNGTLTIQNTVNNGVIEASPLISGNQTTSTGYLTGGGGVYAGSSSTFNFVSGTIAGNTANTGGGIFMNGNNFTMGAGAVVGDASKTTAASNTEVDGVKQYSNFARESGGGIYWAGGSIESKILSAGTIAYNYATQAGGGISGSSGMTMTGGLIKYNGSNYAGGFGYMELVMSGGEISYNQTSSYGAGVRGSLTMTGGLISHNTGGGYGGGVAGGTITISGGEVSYNTAATGGGLYTDNNTCTISGTALITHNSANDCGAIFMGYQAGAVLNILGGEISNNTSSGHLIENPGTTTISGGSITGNTAGAQRAIITSTNGTITIQDTIENDIVVASPVISGNSGTYIFYKNKGTFNMSGGTIGIATWNTTPTENNNANKGTAIATSGANVTITGGVVKGTYGSGLNLAGSAGTVAISDFVSAYNSGIGIQIGRPFTMTTTLVDHNGNKGVHLDENGTITNSTISNTAAGAGLFFYYRTVTVSGCNFVNNHGGYGGGIATYGTLTVTNCTFTGNVATHGGGAICINAGRTTVGGGTVIGDVNWNTKPTESNYANKSTGGYGGGAICMYNKAAVLNLNDCTIAGNYGKSNYFGGGAIGCQNYNDCTGSININGATIKYNATNLGGGGICAKKFAVNFYSGTIDHNYTGSSYNGGGILGENTINITGGTISNNQAGSSGGGVMLDNSSATLTVSGCTISNNTAAYGAGIRVIGTLVMTDTTVSNNIATSNGALHLQNATIDGCTISGNTGNGIYAQGSNYSTRTTLAITDTEISGNTGRGVSVYCVDLTIDDNTQILNNTSTAAGGGVYGEVSLINIISATISGNTAQYGGGIYNQNGQLNISGGTISNNTTTYSSIGGAGIGQNTGSATTFGTVLTSITGGTISGNTASSYGGAIEIIAGELSISGGTITGNSAVDGAGIYLNSGSATISGGTITSNTASRNGGGIFNKGTVNIYGGTISDNSAYNGGGIYAAGTMTLSGGTITNNTATVNGNDIYLVTSSYISVAAELNNNYVVYKNGITSLDDGDAASTYIAYSTNATYLASALSHISVENLPSGTELSTTAKANYMVVINSPVVPTVSTIYDKKARAETINTMHSFDKNITDEREIVLVETAWFDDKHRKLSALGVEIVTTDTPVDGLIV